jgi:hypothetical protein
MIKFAYIRPYYQGIPNYLPKQMFESMVKLQCPKIVPISWIQRRTSGLVGLNKHFMVDVIENCAMGEGAQIQQLGVGEKGKVDVEELLS